MANGSVDFRKQTNLAMDVASKEMRRRRWVLVWCGLAWSGLAAAEPPKGGGDAAIIQTLRKAQGMLRQLSQEKADLEAKNAALEEQRKALEAKLRQLEPLQSEVKQAKAGLESLQSRNEALQQQLSGQATRLQGAADAQRKLGSELERYRRDNRLLVNAVNERTRWIEECTGKNAALVRANREIVEKLSHRSFWDSLKQAEPFTGVGAVAAENAAQEFHYKLDDLEVTPWKEPQAELPLPSPDPQSSGEATPPQ